MAQVKFILIFYQVAPDQNIHKEKYVQYEPQNLEHDHRQSVLNDKTALIMKHL